jgi:hypothetical protein
MSCSYKKKTMKKHLLTSMKNAGYTLLALIFLCSFQGCRYYYKVQTVNRVTPHDIKKFDSLNKYLILHQGDSAWHLSEPGIADNTLSGNLSVLPKNHLKYKTTKTHGGNRYIKRKAPYEGCVIGEVHLYLQDSVSPKISPGDSIRIALSNIGRAEVYKKAKGRTTASWLIPAFGVPALGVAVVAIIIVASGGLNYNFSVSY